MNSLTNLGIKAKEASLSLAMASSELKNKALTAIATALKENSSDIVSANALDIKAAEEKGMSKAMLDRLSLDEKRVFAMADGGSALCELPDPVGNILDEYERPNGIKINI